MAIALDPSRLVNPIWLKSVRSRLRLKHMASHGTVVVTVTAFIYMIIYMNMTEQADVTPATAAKAVIPGIIVIQGIILMMFGTGAVASGIAQERDDRLIDYQRMTPMSPTSKIIGYMFGLPAREYFLFALTLPFLVVAVWVSHFSLLTLAHFYMVFFTSVWVYHMTGLVAGMLSSKPRFASILSMGIVMALYFVLPNLSRFGITYFEFLTIRPTFFGLLQQELPEGAAQVAPQLAAIDTFRDIPFFGFFLHPTVYTMLVQGFLLSVMFVVVHRKWKNQTNHPLSKVQALVVYTGVLGFLLASVWSLITLSEVRHEIFDPFSNMPSLQEAQTLLILLIIYLSLSGAAFFLVIMGVTPSRTRAIEGLRRARKHGRRRIGVNEDSASSFLLACIMIVMTGISLVTMIVLARRTGEFFTQAPSISSVIGLLAIGTFIGLFIHGLRERCGALVFLISTFLFWIVPLFVMTILFSAYRADVVGTFVGLPCPPVSIWLAVATMLESATTTTGTHPEMFTPDQLQWHYAFIAVSLSLYGVLAVGVQLELWRWKKRMREAILTGPNEPGDAATLAAVPASV
jgi:hypothetical protein